MFASLRRSFVRLLFVSPLVALFITSCAHTPEARRGIAADDVMKVSSESVLNPKGEAGAYKIDFTAHYPLGKGRTFKNVVDIFEGIKVSTYVSNALAIHKDSPLNKIRTATTLGTPNLGPDYNLSYVVNGYPDGHPNWGDGSKVDCIDKYSDTPAGHGSWSQICDPDNSYDTTAKYMSALHQVSKCDESAGAVDCTFIFTGTMNPVTFPFIKRVALKILFGASEYTAAQAGNLSVVNQLHSFYAISELLKTSPPYTAAGAKAAVETYIASPEYAAVSKLKTEHFPPNDRKKDSLVFKGPSY